MGAMEEGSQVHDSANDTHDGAEQFQVPTEKSNVHDPERRAREFKARHIQMMALGAAVGSGLLYQSGKVLYFGGPVSLWLGYLIGGTVLYSVLITLGEMISLLPIPGGFVTLASRCLSPAIGFATGWAYWFAYVIGFGTQLVAAQNIMSFWLPKDKYPPEIWITVFLVIPVLFNNFNVRKYGEIEYWLTVIKVTTFVGIIVMGILLPINASPDQRLLGTDGNLDLIVCAANETIPCVGEPGFGYWREDGFKSYLLAGSAGRFIGLWACICQAMFAYSGAELIGIAADETERQRETLPKAVRRVSYRIVFYYVGCVVVLGLNVSAQDPVLASYVSTGSYTSPFELMVRRAGIPGLAHVINVVALIAVTSVANANLYSRTLYALAMEKQAPKFFQTKNRWDVPTYSLAVSTLPAFLAFISVKVGKNNAFDFLSELTTTCAMVPWAVICGTYLRFRRAARKQNMTDAIPEKAISPLQPYLAIYGLAWSLLLRYLAFFKNNPVWNITSDSWGFTLAPWIAIFAVLLLVAAWIVKEYFVEHEWTFGVPPIRRVDLSNGVAPYVEDDAKPESKLIRGILWVLNNI